MTSRPDHELPLADQLHFDLIREARLTRRAFADARARVATWEPAPTPTRRRRRARR